MLMDGVWPASRLACHTNAACLSPLFLYRLSRFSRLLSVLPAAQRLVCACSIFSFSLSVGIFLFLPSRAVRFSISINRYILYTYCIYILHVSVGVLICFFFFISFFGLVLSFLSSLIFCLFCFFYLPRCSHRHFFHVCTWSLCFWLPTALPLLPLCTHTHTDTHDTDMVDVRIATSSSCLDEEEEEEEGDKKKLAQSGARVFWLHHLLQPATLTLGYFVLFCPRARNAYLSVRPLSRTSSAKLPSRPPYYQVKRRKKFFPIH